MLQPRVAERFLGDEEAEDQGILSRVLVCMPELNRCNTIPAGIGSADTAVAGALQFSHP